MDNRPPYGERRAQRERVERVAAGQGVSLTRALSMEVRTKILYAMADACPGKVDPDLGGDLWPEIADRIRSIASRSRVKPGHPV